MTNNAKLSQSPILLVVVSRSCKILIILIIRDIERMIMLVLQYQLAGSTLQGRSLRIYRLTPMCMRYHMNITMVIIREARYHSFKW